MTLLPQNQWLELGRTHPWLISKILTHLLDLHILLALISLPATLLKARKESH